MRIVLLLVAIALFAAGTIMAFLSNVAGAGASYGAAVLCLVFVFLSSFSKFKGFGIEAELLDRKIAEADELIKRLKAMSLPIGEMLFSIVARLGRLGSAVPHMESYRMMVTFQEQMIKNGVSDEELKAAKKDWHRYNLLDLARPVLRDLLSMMWSKQKVVNERIAVIRQPIDANNMAEFEMEVAAQRHIQGKMDSLRSLFDIENADELPHRIASLLKELDFIAAEEKEAFQSRNGTLLADLVYYRDNKEFRDLQRWFRLGEDSGEDVLALR
jgi:hypothetical protein